MDSVQLQNISQGLLFPLNCNQNALKWPHSSPKVYHQYNRVISCVTAQGLGPLGLKSEVKTDSEQLQNVSKGLLYLLVCAQNGLKWHLWFSKSTTSKPGLYSVSLYRIWDHWGPKKRPKQTQNSSRTFFRVTFSSCLS